MQPPRPSSSTKHEVAHISCQVAHIRVIVVFTTQRRRCPSPPTEVPEGRRVPAHLAGAGPLLSGNLHPEPKNPNPTTDATYPTEPKPVPKALHLEGRPLVQEGKPGQAAWA